MYSLSKLTGKGIYIWKIENAEGGDIQEIVGKSYYGANFSHVLVKIADGIAGYNWDLDTGEDLAKTLVEALHEKGIMAIGWHYLYGEDPVGEAEVALRRISETGVDAYVMDVEREWESPGMEDAAKTFFAHFEDDCPIEIGFSSSRFPDVHPKPYNEFLSRSVINMPQVYWEERHDPREQLQRSYNEYAELTDIPFFPTGSAYGTDVWQATPEELIEFMDEAKAMDLPGVNFWEWSTMKDPNDLWHTIRDYEWEIQEPTLEERVAKLESKLISFQGKLDKVIDLASKNTSQGLLNEKRIRNTVSEIGKTNSRMKEAEERIKGIQENITDLKSANKLNETNIANNRDKVEKAMNDAESALSQVENILFSFDDLKKFVIEKVNILNDDIQELDKKIKEHTHDENGGVSSSCGLIRWLKNLLH